VYDLKSIMAKSFSFVPGYENHEAMSMAARGGSEKVHREN
jgi:hypothetical protein